MTSIGHVDLDAFFARCEQRRRPELEGKPLVVCVYTRGGSSGAVSTCNYEARELGIESAMPLSQARKRASSDTVFLSVDHEHYSKMSSRVLSKLRSHSPEVQRYSIDEAFFRVDGSPVETAKRVKADIETLGLSSSVGVGPNRFVAKMASEEDKPDGLTVVSEEEVSGFLEDKAVEQLHGVGEKTAGKLRELGIQTCEDMRQVNSSRLVDELGRKRAASLKAKTRGEGATEFGSSDRKQMSKIVTMEQDSGDPDYVQKELARACQQLVDRLEQDSRAFSRVGIVAKDVELETYTRWRKVKTSRPGEKLFEEAGDLLDELMAEEEPELRRVGVRVSELVDTDRQTALSAF